MADLKNIEITWFERVTQKDKAFFARQLATMLESGLAIDKALRIFIEQTKNNKLKKVLSSVLKKVQEGDLLSNALKSYPDVFDKVFINIIVSGEAVGRLSETLKKLADNLEKENSFMGQVKSALYYPAFIFVAMIVIVIIMMIYVIPPLKDIFSEFQAELPWTTRMLLSISGFAVTYWWIVLLIFIVIGVILFYYFKTPNGKYLIARVEINFPSGIGKDIYMTRYCSTLSMLLASGTPIIKALDITSEVMNNPIYYDQIKKSSEQMERGVPLSSMLIGNKDFDPLVSQMVKVGEETGKLDKTLDKLASYFEQETNRVIKGINSLIEPVLIVVIGLGVAFIVFAIIMPIYQLVQLQ